MNLMKTMKEGTGMGYAPICAKEDSIWKSVRIGFIKGDENMSVPEIVNKIKFGVVNGKIVPTGTVGVEQLVGYDMSDFTEEDLRSLIQAGHEDYFDDSEKDKLRELGILGEEAYLDLIHPARTTSAYELFNDNDELISSIPEDEVTYCNVGEADKLTDEDKEAFLIAYDEAKAMEDVRVKYFFWFFVPERYLPDFGWLKYDFTCPGENVEVTVNGHPMDVQIISGNEYYAKLTDLGAVAILVSIGD